VLKIKEEPPERPTELPVKHETVEVLLENAAAEKPDAFQRLCLLNSLCGEETKSG
jgi:hypothetical protein